MRPWLSWGLAALLLSACPLEPLTVTGFGVSSSAIKAGGIGNGSTVTLSVPGLRAQDASGLTAMLNGVPVPIATTRDGELAIKLPPGIKTDPAKFELWRNGELLTSRDIGAQLATGTGLSAASGLSPADAVTVRTNGEPTSTTTLGSGGVTINITMPAGSGSGGTTVVTTGGSSGSGSGSGSGATPTATPTSTPTPPPEPTPIPTPTPTPVPTLVPVADQTPVPGGTGEVQGNVQF
jgi:hypothetical protein